MMLKLVFDDIRLLWFFYEEECFPVFVFNWYFGNLVIQLKLGNIGISLFLWILVFSGFMCYFRKKTD